MFPQEAKLRNFTYASTMTVDITIEYIVHNNDDHTNPRKLTKTLSKINIGKLPIMLKSAMCVLTQNPNLNPRITGECNMDCGDTLLSRALKKLY